MAFIIKWNLSIGIVAFMAYVVQKIMGKRLGHYWRKIVWILLTLKMCFPFWSVTEKFRQHPFMISMPAYISGTKSKDRDHDENGKRFNSKVDVRRNFCCIYGLQG